MAYMSTFSTPPPVPLPDSSRVAGAAMYENDAAIMAALDIAWKLPCDELMACEVGVRNMQGRVYRRAAVKGVAQMLYFEERMTALGFVAEREDSEHDGSGFDIIFRHRGLR